MRKIGEVSTLNPAHLLPLLTTHVPSLCLSATPPSLARRPRLPELDLEKESPHSRSCTQHGPAHSHILDGCFSSLLLSETLMQRVC